MTEKADSGGNDGEEREVPSMVYVPLSIKHRKNIIGNISISTGRREQRRVQRHNWNRRKETKRRATQANNADKTDQCKTKG